MGIKLVQSKPFDDRASATISDTVTDGALATWKAGMIITEGTDGTHVLADGAGTIPDTKILAVGGARADVRKARAISYYEGPGSFLIDTEGYVGSPVKGSDMAIGTGANVGKLVIAAAVDAATLKARVAVCTKAPDANGYAKFKFVR